ncbi:MAG: alpha/beta hydrolase [Oceanobacter sp.]|jgi:pimeloyl-ACP methyl ester carboxylesterase|nr:MAG: alpha/beta hydrolase [Oceanobacter sp.]
MKLLKGLVIVLIVAFIGIASSVYFAPAKTAAFLVDLKRGLGDLEKHEMTLKNGQKYVYLEAGDKDKETLVLLHGFGADKDNFTESAPYLKDDFHLIVPDHIGFGESSKPKMADYTPIAQARRLHELFTRLGLDRQIHIGGSSMGGHIAMTYAALYPAEVKSLWLLDPGGVWSAPESEMRRIVRETGVNPLTAKTPEEFRDVFSMVMSKPPFVPGFVLDQMAAKRIANFELEQTIFAQLSADNVEERVTGLDTPTLLVWGKEDRVLNVGATDILEKLMTNVTTIKMDGIGHLPQLEAPKQTAEDLKAFIAGLEK